MRAVSARVARVADDEYDPLWPTLHGKDSAPKKQQSTASSTVIFGLVLATALILGSSGVPFSSSGSGEKGDKGGFGFTALFRSEPDVNLRDDFSQGLTAWRGERGDGWTRVNGITRPGKLRLWASTEKLKDYQFEFSGQIEKKAMGWAYRAPDLKNYYATKIVLTQPGPLPRAELVRYTVLNGTPGTRTKLPLPLVIRADTVYQIKVNVRGDQFSTSVNGQMVDTWTDGKLTAGGVGLFAEAGEAANVRYAAIANRESVLGQVLSYFGFLLPPSAF